MAEYEFRIPSKAVPYGYVNVRFDADPISDSELGLMYGRAVRDFWIAEAGDLDNPAPFSEAPADASIVTQEQAEEAVKSELGGIASGNAWDEDAPEVPKPWVSKPKFNF